MKSNFSRNKKVLSVGRQGFSLLELLVSIFIFSLIMTIVTTIFVQVFNSRKKAKEIQVNIEDARYAMELIAKSLRMSNVKSGDAALTDNIVVYDYSQSSCIRYYADAGELKVGYSGDDEPGCGSSSIFDAPRTMISGNLNNFSLKVESSDNDPAQKKIGRVTMAMTICADDTCRTKETIQTTVSLRDYGYVTDAP